MRSPRRDAAALSGVRVHAQELYSGASSAKTRMAIGAICCHALFGDQWPANALFCRTSVRLGSETRRVWKMARRLVSLCLASVCLAGPLWRSHFGGETCLLRAPQIEDAVSLTPHSEAAAKLPRPATRALVKKQVLE